METEAEDDAAENASSQGEVVDSDGDDSVQSDALSVVSDLEDGPVADSGPWILNVMSGWYHRTVQRNPSAAMSAELAYGKACRPSGVLGDRYEVRTLDPGLEGYCACRHSACFGMSPGA